ncbi:COP1-interacting protein 7-like isoform X1 [Ipomoea triloba]|uniref:COP1-interacting protein 7-like isoform X1 n=1 Tax=Ipomoea triloba TaxID=35885 RepID=UPI00125DA44E|nr:COP1-interacting protein 7-like isoform X1 [Ipomoea triloba]
MAGGMHTDVLLDYVEFQIYPSQNRYEACICWDNEVEAVASGVLEQLAQHSSKVKALSSKGWDATFKLEPPDNVSEATWFSKSTLIRFLNIISSVDILDKANAMEKEISQLEEARGFHLSLYAKADDNSATSDSSKNELLRAMDVRLGALRRDLADAFDEAAGAPCSPEEIVEIGKFSDHFGAVKLRNFLQKFVRLSQVNQNYLGNDKRGLDENSQISSKPLLSEQPVRYGASPAKAAQIERQSSSEGEESSCTTEEDQPSVERSRPLVRSASPRRSASPMRRVQIGRSGSRRPTALAIKSLHYIPAREKLVCQKDEGESSSGEEASEKPSKRSDNNVRRMSVQDAINLFERKQRDQTTVDVQKTSSVSLGANKAVLRRWSAGMYESPKYPANAASENSASMNTENLEGEETISALETNLDSDPTPYSNPDEATEIEAEPVCEERVSSLEGQRADTLPNQTEESRKLTASAEWSRQKEAELNQLLIKMMETKPARYRNAAPSDNQDQRLPDQQRGGLYNHYKEKRDEKLKGETARKRVGKETQVKAKPDMASGKANTVSKRPVKRTQTPLNHSSESANSKSETPKPADVKKVSKKASSLPAIRKSWPTAPSPRANGASPAKTPVTTASATATRRRSHPTPLVPQSTPKVERSQVPAKSAKTLPNDAKKTVRNSAERNQQAVTKASSKPTKTKAQAPRVSSDSSAKPKLNKVTKKSSVVPLEPKDTPKEPKEPKPFLRKGSRTGPGVGPITKKKTSPPEQSLRDSVEAEKNEKDPIISEPSNQKGDVLVADSKVDLDLASETQIGSPEKCEDTESPNLVAPKNEEDNFCEKQECANIKNEVEEEINISPAAWVEIEEHDNGKVQNNDGANHIDSSADVPVRAASPRVRHSLSQMLLEESSEPDSMDWGNAENPPTMVYQKDAPKGFKRLLKFARKSKTDVNSSGFSSPSVFSEGEDDTEESKGSKKASDNLLKKATLHATNYGHGHELPAQATIGQLVSQSISQKLEEGHVSASVTTTKAPRSFFSLSAFKGSKQTDSKLR